MKDLIKLEYKKFWNGVTKVSLIALGVLTVVYAVVVLNIQYRTIDKNGNLVTGLASFRALKEAAEDLEGELDGEYIRNLIEDYDSSFDKAYLDEHRGFLGTGGMTKYIVSNYVINYAYYGPYMSNGNEKIGLDYDFLNSEESFYEKYRDAVMEYHLYVNEWNGLFPFSEEQIAVLQNKVDHMRTPFRIAYHTGLAHINNYFGMEYPVFFVLLAFCLASVYAKDSTNGVDELSLSSLHGRKTDMMARWIAGNLFTVTAYLIYVGIIAIVHGAIAGFGGFGASAQLYWFECIYNFSVGTGLLLIFFGGMAGALVMANIAMLLSIKTKNAKVATVVGIITVWLLVKGTRTYSQIKLLDPIRFGGSESAVNFLFVGNVIVPYFMIILMLASVYISVLWLAMRISYKKYNLN